MPTMVGHLKRGPDYRFIVVRDPLSRPPLPGMEGEMELSVPVMPMPNRGWYEVRGIVTNRELAGDQVVRRHRERCGKGEEVHGVLKEDLTGGRLPPGLFGANAPWWAMTVRWVGIVRLVKSLAPLPPLFITPCDLRQVQLVNDVRDEIGQMAAGQPVSKRSGRQQLPLRVIGKVRLAHRPLLLLDRSPHPISNHLENPFSRTGG